MRNKIVLFSVLAVFALFAVIAVPSVSATYPANAIYLELENSNGLYCENNTLVEVWVNANVVTTGVHGDRAVNVIDVVLIYKRALDPGYPLDLPWAGDVNCDRNINVIDVVMVYKRALDPGYDLDCCCEVV